MEAIEYEQVKNFLMTNTIPSGFKKYTRKNFIRKCSVYRLGEKNNLFKVRYNIICNFDSISNVQPIPKLVVKICNEYK